MKKGILHTALYTIVYMLILSTCWAQEEERTRFSDLPDSYRRLSTSAKDKKVLLPKYDDIASEREKGITLEDWEKSYLSPKSFFLLDENNDEIISREELDKDKFMGESQLYQQTNDLIKQVCKTEFSDYSDRLRALKKRGYQNIDQDVSFVANKKIEFTANEEPPFSLQSEYKPTEVATKTYIQLKHGQSVSKKVDLGTYALLLMRDQKEEESITIHLFAGIMLLVVASVTFILGKS